MAFFGSLSEVAAAPKPKPKPKEVPHLRRMPKSADKKPGGGGIKPRAAMKVAHSMKSVGQAEQGKKATANTNSDSAPKPKS